jgi:hypothetical protein
VGLVVRDAGVDAVDVGVDVGLGPPAGGAKRSSSRLNCRVSSWFEKSWVSDAAWGMIPT